MLNRREALQLLATGAVLQLAPSRLLAALREAHSVLGTEAAHRTLNAHQSATVTTMAELILPKTDTPGATDVGACEFIDLILTEWYEEAERERFLAGLADVDVRAKSLFGKDFIGCSPAQQADLLTALGEQMVEAVDRAARGTPIGTDKNFYSMLRRWTLTAYYTSEAGATAELNYEVIPDHYDGCAEVGAGKGETEGQ
jgi:gluconate 2-dehydrogenase gamma chain